MIPDKLINFMCYNESKQLIGVTDATLPEVAYMTESIKGAGIAGEIDSPVIGHLQSMTTTINWRSLIDENAVFISPKTYLFDFRGSVQIYNGSSGEYEPKRIRCVMKCIPKKVTLGNLDTAAAMGTSGEFEVVYIKLFIKEKEIMEIDKINFKCVIDGTDYLAKVRRDIGLN